MLNKPVTAMAKHNRSFTSIALVAACFLALVCGALASSGRELHSSGPKYGSLVGKWQGTCVQKYSDGHCADDIITYPYYVEYKYDKYKNKYYTQYRQDAVHITTDNHYNSPRWYDLPSYSGKGYVDFYSAGSSSYCVNAWYEDNSKRTYRIKVKHEGDLDFMVEEGEYDYDHHGIWGKCFNKSYKSLFCNSYTYSYRCYLARTSYDYKW